MRLLPLTLITMTLSGCLISPPETLSDTWTTLHSSIVVPDDSVLISSEQNGPRSRFAGVSRPNVANYYYAAWDDGHLCERQRSIAEQAGMPGENGAVQCQYQANAVGLDG